MSTETPAPGPGHVQLAGVLRQVQERLRVPSPWGPVMRRLADRDGLLLAELERLEPLLWARSDGRRSAAVVSAVAAVTALNGEAVRAAELWRWLLARWADGS